ncbi:MAG: amino acid adenylation enzyme/thioester reductase family protein [Planctomycetota bacterium]|nr:amino acid adenylation enzyme/thioester reductase family protein [Planctomycetota bacterium]
MSTDARHLSQLLDDAATRRPESVAVEDEHGRSLTYAQLAQVADRVSARLARWGVDRGDRVGLMLPKSPEAVAAIHGILRTGAAYVPVDPAAPPLRSAGIFVDCGVRAVVVSAALAPALRQAWPGPGPLPRLVVVGEEPGASGPGDASWDDILADDAPSPFLPSRHADDLAYILPTSGSTGRPKGVMLSHANAFCFLDWCDHAFDLRDDDRFSSHAPFHFDLSIFDLFASCRRGGTLVLIGEATGRDPSRVGVFLRKARIDVWYSAPSILSLLTDHGDIDVPAPRLVLFAGEVFPIRPLKSLRTAWPGAAMWNLYGPTETNVCTAFPIPATIPEDRDEPYPIGRVCPPLSARVIDEDGRDVPPGTIGELLISGPGVMRGYFARQNLTVQAFVVDDLGARWYRTGDLVEDDGTGVYLFRGRRDRMVKKRGFRIELGEIESALYRHEDVATAAVVARSGDDGVAISAFVAMKPGRKGSIIAMKRHCTLYLPHYMIPDRVAFVPDLPRTSTDKVDYAGLSRISGRGEGDG